MSRSVQRRPKYTPEFRERAIRMALEAERSIRSVAEDQGVKPATLTSWVQRDRRGRPAAARSAPSVPQEELAERDEQAQARRLAELEAENAQLRRANEILKAATAFFAQEADPTRPSR